MEEKNGFLTPREMERKKRRRDICSLFLKFRTEYPELSASRIMRVIAGQYFGCTEQNIRYILTKEGVYVKRKKI